MPYLKRINSLPLINHISYKYAQVSDIGPSWSSCLFFASYLGSAEQNTGVYWEMHFYDFSTIIIVPLLENVMPGGGFNTIW